MRPSEGDIVNYRHMTSADVYGPVRVVAVHEGSNRLVVTDDPSMGRTFSLMFNVTVILPLPAGEVEQ